MAKLIYVCLLIIYVVFAQEIGNSSSADENVEKALNHREKRLAHSLMNGRPMTVPYIVYILKNGRYHCVGTILTDEIILTSAKCIYEDNGVYMVSVPEGGPGGETMHSVNYKTVYSTFNPRTFENDLGLLMINSPILERNLLHRIPLHNETLHAHLAAVFTGMGRSGHALRTEVLATIENNVCQREYSGFRDVTVRNICAVGMERRGVGFPGDSGGPLVVAGKIVGVYSWTGRTRNPTNADVFMNLLYPAYKTWIEENIRQHHG